MRSDASKVTKLEMELIQLKDQFNIKTSELKKLKTQFNYLQSTSNKQLVTKSKEIDVLYSKLSDVEENLSSKITDIHILESNLSSKIKELHNYESELSLKAFELQTIKTECDMYKQQLTDTKKYSPVIKQYSEETSNIEQSSINKDKIKHQDTFDGGSKDAFTVLKERYFTNNNIKIILILLLLLFIFWLLFKYKLIFLKWITKHQLQNNIPSKKNNTHSSQKALTKKIQQLPLQYPKNIETNNKRYLHFLPTRNDLYSFR